MALIGAAVVIGSVVLYNVCRAKQPKSEIAYKLTLDKGVKENDLLRGTEGPRLIAQVTNEEEISKMINEGKAVFYIGFDPTADSLHVGHFMALCLMKRLQMAGNRPIALIGGGTGYIGDPSRPDGTCVP